MWVRSYFSSHSASSLPRLVGLTQEMRVFLYFSTIPSRLARAGRWAWMRGNAFLYFSAILHPQLADWQV
jgi:hypothetical protein